MTGSETYTLLLATSAMYVHTHVYAHTMYNMHIVIHVQTGTLTHSYMLCAHTYVLMHYKYATKLGIFN